MRSKTIDTVVLNAASQLMAGGLAPGARYLFDGDIDSEDYQKFMKSRELQFRRTIEMVLRCYDECLSCLEDPSGHQDKDSQHT